MKTKYLLNSKIIKRAVEHHEAGLLSVWQFLVKCSHSCAGYERRQRHWALGIENGNEIIEDILDDNFIVEDAIAPDEPQIIPDVVEQTPRNCMVCLVTAPNQNIPQFIVLPCGHAWVCETCVSVLENEYPRSCPVCRGNVHNFQRLFLT